MYEYISTLGGDKLKSTKQPRAKIHNITLNYGVHTVLVS